LPFPRNGNIKTNKLINAHNLTFYPIAFCQELFPFRHLEK
jgi:hypothetical protein